MLQIKWKNYLETEKKNKKNNKPPFTQIWPILSKCYCVAFLFVTKPLFPSCFFFSLLHELILFFMAFGLSSEFIIFAMLFILNIYYIFNHRWSSKCYFYFVNCIICLLLSMQFWFLGLIFFSLNLHQCCFVFLCVFVVSPFSFVSVLRFFLFVLTFFSFSACSYFNC